MDLATIYNRIYMVKPPSIFDYRWPNIKNDEISNLAMKPHALCMRSHLHGVSKWKKNIIVGIGMVETRRCTDLILARFDFR